MPCKEKAPILGRRSWWCWVTSRTRETYKDGIGSTAITVFLLAAQR
jgi:hypothetical protein